jgi:hypothetical protein
VEESDKTVKEGDRDSANGWVRERKNEVIGKKEKEESE